MSTLINPGRVDFVTLRLFLLATVRNWLFRTPRDADQFGCSTRVEFLGFRGQ